MARKLNSALSPARLALLRAVAQVAHEQHCALYIVGGFVRDLLLDRPGLDFDLVVEGDAIGLAHALAERYGGRVTGHSRFGTAKWIIRGIYSDLAKELQLAEISSKDLPGSLDLVTARTEFYTHPSALPTVERSSIKLDFHRRDFTINTMALRLDGSHWGELYDYWGGLNDLRRGLVRVLHSLSFVDDPTRILRAVRFEQRFSFRIEARTLELIKEAAALLDRVSGDRIRHEINTILVEERSAQMLSRLNELELLKAIHPDLVWDRWLREKISELPVVNDGKDAPDFWELAGVSHSGIEIRREIIYVLWLLRLSPGSARSVAARLKLPTDLTRTVLAAIDLWPKLPSLAGAAPSKVVALLDGTPTLAITALYQALDRPDLKEILYTYVKRWQHVSPTIDGNSLRARGLKPGPHYRSILLALRDAWLDGEVSSAAQEAALLDKLIVESTGR
jgi:tRNA nucleotidyltransferase (CCA-adding enzyme)